MLPDRNCTRDPEVKYTPKGTAVAELGLAINRVLLAEEGQERREEVTFVDVTVWGRQAEVAQQYVTKGKPVLIEGRLQLDTWQDKDGQKRSKLKVVCEHLQLLGSASGKQDGAPASKAPAAKAGKPRTQAPASRDPDLDAEPDHIPFARKFTGTCETAGLTDRCFNNLLLPVQSLQPVALYERPRTPPNGLFPERERQKPPTQ